MAVCVIVIVIYALTRGDWLNGVLTGLTLAMALIPEEIPVVLTIFLALGAWRMSKQPGADAGSSKRSRRWAPRRCCPSIRRGR